MTDKELLEQFQLMHQAIGDVESRLTARIDGLQEDVNAIKADVGNLQSDVRSLERRMGDMEESIISKIVTEEDIERIADRAASKAVAVAENTFGKTVTAIHEGYTLLREKQEETDCHLAEHDKAIDDILNRIA